MDCPLPEETPGIHRSASPESRQLVLQHQGSRTNVAAEGYYRKAFLDPLGMAKTAVITPTEKDIPGYVVAAPREGKALDGGVTSASGGVFSATNDLAKLGISILNPIFETIDFSRRTRTLRGGGLGDLPEHPARHRPHRGHVPKLGDTGSYSSYLVLIPGYDMSFSVIHASGIADMAAQGAAKQLFAGVVSEAVLPALRAPAAVEVERNFAGTYTDGKSSSSLTVASNGTANNGAVLTLVSFTSDRHDMMAQLAAQLGSMSLVLQPAIATSGLGRQLSCQATPVVDPAVEGTATGLFSKQFAVNSDWLNNNGAT
ncbi:hypothetical protein PG993_001058 [Apiospora rasikravindrae]|uniref:Beta-lactamase-like ARB-00930-like C-terminal domain-containing protein n=1 Tax=Apiospora rasikravindrae TaxID=990691 RepID=A0ABR1UAA4_9PEZI